MRGRSYTAKVVDRDVGRRSAARGSQRRNRCWLLLPVATAPAPTFASSSRSPRPPAYLFLSLSLPPFLLRLLLYFCPFARFLLPQTTAAYLYPVFASRGSKRGRFCVCTRYCRSLCRFCVLLRRYLASLPFRSLPLSFDSSPALSPSVRGRPCASETSTARHFAHEHREMRPMREAIPRLHHLSTRDRVPTGLYYMQHVVGVCGYSR